MDITEELSKIPVATKEEFLSYPLIQYLGQFNRWTFSDNEKRPMSVRAYLETAQYKLANFENATPDTYPLVTLFQLESIQPQPMYDNRAFLFQSKFDYTIMIDVEKDATDEMKLWAINFPAHYVEASKNNGVHVLINIPKEIIPDEYLYLFDLTIIKNKDLEYEVIMNRHYCTFTKRIIPCNYADFLNNEEHKQRLLLLLKGLAELKSKEELEQKQKIKNALTYKNISKEENNELLETFNEYIEEALHEEQIKTKNKVTLEKCTNAKTGKVDHSDYEYKTAKRIVRFYYKYYKHQQQTAKRNMIPTDGFHKSLMQLEVGDFIHLAYQATVDIVPNREKHQELRNGLPYLLYVTNYAWTAIDFAENKKDTKEEK